MYSIWMIPPEPVAGMLKEKINSLALKYAGPLFEPHLTVLGNIERDLSDVEAITRRIAAQTIGMQLSLGPVSFSTTYFQSVFVRVNSSAPLMELNVALKDGFCRQNDVFMPHISLLYGDHDMATREKIVSDMQKIEGRFIISKLTIVPTTNDPATWQHVTSIPFGMK